MMDIRYSRTAHTGNQPVFSKKNRCLEVQLRFHGKTNQPFVLSVIPIRHTRCDKCASKISKSKGFSFGKIAFHLSLWLNLSNLIDETFFNALIFAALSVVVVIQ